ncbi:MAG: GNAT family N-acetyltransferase [Erysipelotrichaceae bacterium]|nr:GNAT family N-acetyltransferase [Erysipelotrichaceae bacterium]
MKHLGTKELLGERLRLRRFVFGDAEAVYNVWASDDEVTKYLTWPTHQSVDTSKSYMEYSIPKYEEKDHYQWAIELKESHELIGEISVVNIEGDSAELGWVLGRKYWGHTYMKEAAELVIKYLFDEINVKEIIGKHDVNNPKSGRVMQKLGMHFEGIYPGAGKNNQGIVDLAVYRLKRDDYELHKNY